MTQKRQLHGVVVTIDNAFGVDDESCVTSGEYVDFPSRYAARLTTAYFARERHVDLRSTPRPQPGVELTGGSEW